jgi:SPP1 family predicted phage head-tail adaptor
MHAGELRHRVTLKSPSTTGGDAAVAYTTKATVWAAFQELSGTDASGLVAEAVARFRMRYRSDLTPRWRLELGTRVFEIESISDRDGRRESLEGIARERQ